MDRTLIAQPKTDPRLDTAIGQLKLVSVIMCLLLRIIAVLKTRYRNEYNRPLTKVMFVLLVALPLSLALTFKLVVSFGSRGARRGKGLGMAILTVG